MRPTSASKPLCYGTALTTSAVAVYTAPGSQGLAYVRGIKLNNRSGAAVTVTLNHVPVGGSASSINEFMSAISIPANTVYEPSYDEGEFSMNAGDAIYALVSSAAAVNIFIYGAEIAT